MTDFNLSIAANAQKAIGGIDSKTLANGMVSSSPIVKMERDPLATGFKQAAGGFNRIGSTLQQLNILNEQHADTLNKLYTVVMAGYAGYLLYEGLRTIILGRTAIETALGAMYAAMAVPNPTLWGNLAIAAASAAIAYSVIQFSSGSWTLPAVDITNPMERERAVRDVRARA